MCKEE
jgi:hypothetical protein